MWVYHRGPTASGHQDRCPAHLREQHSGEKGYILAADGTEQVIAAPEIVADTTGTEPSSGRAAAMGQELPQIKGFEEIALAFIEQGL